MVRCQNRRCIKVGMKCLQKREGGTCSIVLRECVEVCCVRAVGDKLEIAGIPKVRCSESEVLGRLPLLVGGRESYLDRGRLSRLRCLLRG